MSATPPVPQSSTGTRVNDPSPLETTAPTSPPTAFASANPEEPATQETVAPTPGVHLSPPSAADLVQAIREGRFQKVYELKELDTPPSATLQIGAIYPSDLKRRGVQGWVDVAFVVDDKGLPINVHAKDSSDERFKQAAIEAVKKWKFRAGRVAGQSVATSLNVQIKFAVTGSPR